MGDKKQKSVLLIDDRELSPDEMTHPTTNESHKSTCDTYSADAMENADQGENDPLQPGYAVGRYVILALTGTGGMGHVYKAYDPDLARNVALKILHTKAHDEKAAYNQNLLLQEAQIAARLSHPNVVTVYDVGLIEDQVFIAMELIEGESLRYFPISLTFLGPDNRNPTLYVS